MPLMTKAGVHVGSIGQLHCVEIYCTNTLYTNTVGISNKKSVQKWQRMTRMSWDVSTLMCETCEPVIMLHRRSVLIAELRSEVHPSIHPSHLLIAFELLMSLNVTLPQASRGPRCRGLTKRLQISPQQRSTGYWRPIGDFLETSFKTKFLYASIDD